MSDMVLVVDDERIVREMTADFLDEAGLDVLQAASADDALKILSHQADVVSVIFTDVRMPGRIDGLDLAREVQTTWPHIKIIITSGTSEQNALPRGIEFIAKPWLPLDMLSRVLNAATRARVHH